MNVAFSTHNGLKDFTQIQSSIKTVACFRKLDNTFLAKEGKNIPLLYLSFFTTPSLSNFLQELLRQFLSCRNCCLLIAHISYNIDV